MQLQLVQLKSVSIAFSHNVACRIKFPFVLSSKLFLDFAVNLNIWSCIQNRTHFALGNKTQPAVLVSCVAAHMHQYSLRTYRHPCAVLIDKILTQRSEGCFQSLPYLKKVFECPEEFLFFGRTELVCGLQVGFRICAADAEVDLPSWSLQSDAEMEGFVAEILNSSTVRKKKKPTWEKKFTQQALRGPWMAEMVVEMKNATHKLAPLNWRNPHSFYLIALELQDMFSYGRKVIAASGTCSCLPCQVQLLTDGCEELRICLAQHGGLVLALGLVCHCQASFLGSAGL